MEKGLILVVHWFGNSNRIIKEPHHAAKTAGVF